MSMPTESSIPAHMARLANSHAGSFVFMRDGSSLVFRMAQMVALVGRGWVSLWLGEI